MKGKDCFSKMENAVSEKPGLLLHSCCGPCSTAVVERLSEHYRITLFFYNPNITERKEYEKRLAAQKKFIKFYNENRKPDETIKLLEGIYDRESFYKIVEGLEEEPEGGERCIKCFSLRLIKTAEEAKAKGFQYFATTLSVSPHKNHSLICQIGTSLEKEFNITFLIDDFKKKAGFQRSIELSKEYGLYRQNYCGCEFSKKERGA